MCAPKVSKGIDIVRAAGMKASAQLNDDGALTLKTKFVNFMMVGSHGKEIEDNKEIGERLLVWANMRCEPVEAYQNHMGSLYKPMDVAGSRERRRDVSPLRQTKRAREESEERLEKRGQARSRERSRERVRERSRDRARKKSRDPQATPGNHAHTGI